MSNLEFPSDDPTVDQTSSSDASDIPANSDTPGPMTNGEVFSMLASIRKIKGQGKQCSIVPQLQSRDPTLSQWSDDQLMKHAAWIYDRIRKMSVYQRKKQSDFLDSVFRPASIPGTATGVLKRKYSEMYEQHQDDARQLSELQSERSNLRSELTPKIDFFHDQPSNVSDFFIFQEKIATSI